MEDIVMEFYTVKDIQNMLKIKKDVAYRLVHTDGFPKIIIGKSIRVPKDEFMKWVKNYMNNTFELS